MLLGATSVAIAQEEVWEITFDVQGDAYSPYFFVSGNFLIRVSDGKIISESVPMSARYGGGLPCFSESGWTVNNYSDWGREGSNVSLSLNHPFSVGGSVGGDYIAFYGSRTGTETASGDSIIFAYHIYECPVEGTSSHRTGSGSWVGRRIIGENQPPVASFISSPENPNVGQEITFSASSSFDPDGTIVKYEWDLGDGNIAEGQIVTYAYNAQGTYTITLTVTDNQGFTSSAQKTLSVTAPNQPPVASFTYSPENPNVGQEITFSASSSSDPDGDPLTYKWDFDAGNGISIDSAELNPKHSYLASGTYVVTLIANDGKVDSLPATAEITIRGSERRDLNPRPFAWQANALAN